MLGRSRSTMAVAGAVVSAAVLAGAGMMASGASADIIAPLPTVTLPGPLPTVTLPTVSAPVPSVSTPVPVPSLPLPTGSPAPLPTLPGGVGSGGGGTPAGGTPATPAAPGPSSPAARASGVTLPAGAQPSTTPAQRAALKQDDEYSPAMQSADAQYAAADDGLALLLQQIAQFGQARLALLRAEAGLAQLEKQAADVQAGSAAMMARYTSALRSVSSYVRTSYADGAPAGVASVLGSDPTGFVVGLPAAAGGDLAVRSAVDRVQAMSLQAKSAEAEAAVAQGKVAVAKAEIDRYGEELRQLAPYIASAQARAAALMAQRSGALTAMRAAQDGDLLGTQVSGDQIGAQIRAASAKLRAEGKVVNGTGSFALPSTGPVTSHYGWRYHPILHYRKLHTGVDLGQGDGYVRAADDGTVILTISNVAYGNVTVIDHGTIAGRPIATFYAHQAKFLVQPGEVVHKGQIIGIIGQTGWATGPHVHVEVRDDGVPIRPEPFFGL